MSVAATAPIMPDGGEPPSDAYGQAKRCLEIIVAALEEAGASAADVVRTRCYLVAAEDWKEVGRAHGEVFADVRPANAMIVVTGFLDPRWQVEIEATPSSTRVRTRGRRTRPVPSVRAMHDATTTPPM